MCVCVFYIHVLVLWLVSLIFGNIEKAHDPKNSQIMWKGLPQ